MTKAQEKAHASSELIKAQNKITKFARMGVEVGENEELDDAIKKAKFWRRELSALAGI